MEGNQSDIAQAFGIACPKTCNVLTRTRQTCQPRKTETVDDGNIVRAMKKTPKATVSEVT